MTDAHLKALFQEDEPPARDPAFSTAVMERVARRRFLADVASLTGVTFLGGLVLWAFWPLVSPLIAGAGPDLLPLGAALTLAALALYALDGRVTLRAD